MAGVRKGGEERDGGREDARGDKDSGRQSVGQCQARGDVDGCLASGVLCVIDDKWQADAYDATSM